MFFIYKGNISFSCLREIICFSCPRAIICEFSCLREISCVFLSLRVIVINCFACQKEIK